MDEETTASDFLRLRPIVVEMKTASRTWCGVVRSQSGSSPKSNATLTDDLEGDSNIAIDNNPSVRPLLMKLVLISR